MQVNRRQFLMAAVAAPLIGKLVAWIGNGLSANRMLSGIDGFVQVG
jgi:hypothetical protein